MYSSSDIIKQNEQNWHTEVYYGLWVHMSNSPLRWVSMTASSRHVLKKRNLTVYLLTHKQKLREKSGNGTSLKLSRPTYSDIILSVRLHLLNLHKLHHQLGNKVCKAWVYRGYFFFISSQCPSNLKCSILRQAPLTHLSIADR